MAPGDVDYNLPPATDISSCVGFLIYCGGKSSGGIIRPPMRDESSMRSSDTERCRGGGFRTYVGARVRGELLEAVRVGISGVLDCADEVLVC